MVVVLAIVPVRAQAQFGYGYYPGGYAGYGWGGWGGASTVQGSMARGLGYFYNGEGIFNRDTAIAQAVDANTVMRWNQYLYEAQLERNRREQLRLARRRDRTTATGEAIAKRLREDPTAEDIASGNALNVVLDDLSDPRIHSSALRLATTPIKGSTVRSIPFVDASEAVTISMNQLVAKDESWPPALRDDAFKTERDAYRRAINRAMEEDEEGDISPKTIRDVRTAVAALRVKAERTLRKPSREYIQAQGYIRALAGTSRMLENPNVEPILKELEKIENTTVGNLLGFMHSFNLRFGPATTPAQRAIYEELYPVLVNHRDRVVKEAGIDTTQAAKNNQEGSPTDFFRGLDQDESQGKGRGNDADRVKGRDNGTNPDKNPQ